MAFAFVCFVIFANGVAAQVAELIREPILRLNTGQHTAPIIKISIDKKQRFLVAGSNDKTVGVYSIETGRLLKTFRLPLGNDGVGGGYVVAISPDGDSIAVGGRQEILEIVQSTSSTELLEEWLTILADFPMLFSIFHTPRMGLCLLLA